MKSGLIISGGQGSGKSRRAHEEAERIGGHYVETNYHQLSEPFGLSVVLRSNPDTVIVDDMPNDQKAWLDAKQLITNDQVMIKVKYADQRLADISKTNFIFCTGDTDLLFLDDQFRRFAVIKL